MPKKENHTEWCLKKINSAQTKKSCFLSLAISNNIWIDSNIRNGEMISHTQVNNSSTKTTVTQKAICTVPSKRHLLPPPREKLPIPYPTTPPIVEHREELNNAYPQEE